MNKILSLVKNKKGAALMTAISFMTIAVALCAIITTFILAMSKTSSSYTSVNENKIIADQIAADYLDYMNAKLTISPSSFGDYVSSTYRGYTAETTSSPISCVAYETGSSSPLITIVVEQDQGQGNSTYKYTKYEYGNI